MSVALPGRHEVEKNLTWDLTSIFKDEKSFNETVAKVGSMTEKIEREHKSGLKTAEDITACLDEMRELRMIIGWAATYSSLEVAVDQKDQEAQERDLRIESLIAKTSSRLSFIDSQLSITPDKVLKEAAILRDENRGYIEEIIRRKPHMLSPDTEKTLAALSAALESPYRIYNTSKLADLTFQPFEAKGTRHQLSFLSFEGRWEYERDVEVRRAAFDSFSKKLSEYQHTMAATYHTQVSKEKILSELRGYPSVLDYLLHDQKVDIAMYNRQIDIIVEQLSPHMRRYSRLLKKIHSLDKMTYADLKIDIDPDYQPEITIEESKELLKGALGILGDDYSAMLQRAFDERWVDYPENDGKSTGAFCSTPYGSHPFILLTWSGKMADLFTLSHELGHAGHFYLAHKEQSIFNSEPSLYSIEAPSTMNELLLAKYLYEGSEDNRRKRWVLSSLVSKTYYHNFVTHLLEAHYQREVYRIVDKGGSVSAPLLNEIKKKTLETFWGEDVEMIEGAELTWMRQPHYYMGLYPYTYSAGLTIATEVNRRIQKYGQPAVEDWIEVLKLGGTKDPAGLAAVAGVDISTEKPLLNTIEHIGYLIDEIERLTDEIQRTKNI